MGMKQFFETLLNDGEDIDAFALWAFGPTFNDISKGMEYLYAWNVLHGDTYHLKADSEIGSDALNMIDLWRDSIDNR